MGGGGKSTTTSEIKLPEWMNQAGRQTFQQAQAAADANPVQAYQGPTAAGTNQNLDAASAAARSGAGTGQADLNAARGYVQQAATGTTPRVSTQDWNAERAAAYTNPFAEQVQGRTLDEMARRNRMELDDLGDAAQGSRAYGGTRHAVLEAETRKGQDANMLDYLARSNADAYNDAFGKFEADRSSRQGAEATNASLAQGDFMRLLQAGGQSAGIGSTASGLSTQDIDNLVKTGAVQQNTEQGQIGADYQEFLRMQDAPMERYMQLMGLLTGTPTNKTQVDTTQQKGSLLNTLIGAGATAASIFSDRRLKRDIVRMGTSRYGGIYSYRYRWGRKRHIGFMADEVAKIMPAAVKRAFGFDMVDYSMLAGA